MVSSCLIYHQGKLALPPLNSVGMILSLVMVSPFPLLVFFNVKRAVAGRGFEPFTDNIVSYILLVVVFAASAISTALYHTWGPRHRHVVTYGLAGAAGSTALLTAADLIDSYFSGPGVGWAWPLTGFILGFAFGGVFRAAHSGSVLR